MILEKRTFVNSDFEKNANKFWIIERDSSNNVTTRYGRVGQSGASTTKSFLSELKAKAFFESKIRDKLKVKDRRDGYTEIHILDDSVVTQNISSKHLSDIAVEQIKTSSEEVRDLIRFMSDINIHNITSNTTIKYNSIEGCFRTPLGVVDQSCINNARELLKEIAGFPDKTDKECVKKASMYMRYIPMDAGGSHIKIHVNDIFGSPALLEKQEGIIDALEAALNTDKPVQKTTERLFDVEIELCKDVDDVRSLYGNLDYHIANIYNVRINSMEKTYNNHGKSIGNLRKLFHGTNPANILSILKRGLVIRESVNGSRFGRGLYFSDKSSMSLGYANQYNRNGKYLKYMFVSEVALGKTCFSPGESLSADYNSRWVERDLYSSQVIIYNTNQSNIVYLLELTK